MISIIIPYLSNSECIDLCKQKISENTRNDYEIIEITDNTDVYAAYNLGAELANNEILVFLNDDMIVAPSWDVEMVNHCEENTVVTNYLVESGYVKPAPTNIERDFGKSPDDFDYNGFVSFTKSIYATEVMDGFGWYMPFAIRKSSFHPYPNEQKYPHSPNDILLFKIFQDRGYAFKKVNSFTYHFQCVSNRPNMESKAKFIISRYAEDISWIKDYKVDYVIYNKGEELSEEYNTKTMPNIGNNQYDIFHFIHENYDNLPEVMAFVQGDPFYHCKKEVFDKLILRRELTALETCDLAGKGKWKRNQSGEFIELNDSWYIPVQDKDFDNKCAYESYDEFMSTYFTGYIREEWNRFAPASQYIVTKEDALKRPREFWELMLCELPRNHMTEGHIIERAMTTILEGKLKEKNILTSNDRIASVRKCLSFLPQGGMTKDELFKLQEICADKMVIELGSYAGASSCMIATVCHKVHCIDMWDDTYEHLEHDKEQKSAYTVHGKRVKSIEDLFTKNCEIFIEGKSIIPHKGNTLDLAPNFEDKAYDIVLIDADHSYQGVSQDFEAYKDKIVDGGLMLFHDYGDTKWKDIKVFCDEKVKSNEIEIVEVVGRLAICRRVVSNAS